MCDFFSTQACRACLKVDEAELFDWHTEEFDNNYNYAKCFQEVTHLSLSQDMPQMLCYECAYELRIAKDFINRAHKVDRKLRSYIENRPKIKLNDSADEKIALFEVPTVDLEEISQSDPACCAEAEPDDWIEKFVAEALVDPFNDLGQQTFANTAPIEQSIDLGSHEAELVLIKPPNLPYEEENLQQTARSECDPDQTVGPTIDPILCADMLDVKMETAMDWKNDKESTKKGITNNEEEISDCLLVQLELTEKNSQIACTGGDNFTPKSESTEHNLISKPPRARRKVEPHQCELCAEIFPNKSKFSYHMDHVHGVRPWMCHACPRIFKRKSNLRRHETIHEDREHKFGCDVCGIKCLTKTILRGHLQVHEKDRKPKYTCEECGKTFYVRSGLVLHKRHHTGDTVSCKVCGRAFPRPVDLKVHMRTHSKERPYKCDICALSFQNVTQLRYHKVTHEGVQYNCDVCDKVFTHITMLRRHKKYHDEPTHQCRVCEKPCYSKYKAKQHIKKVHKISTAEEAEELVICLKKEKSFHGRRYDFKLQE